MIDETVKINADDTLVRTHVIFVVSSMQDFLLLHSMIKLPVCEPALPNVQVPFPQYLLRDLTCMSVVFGLSHVK